MIKIDDDIWEHKNLPKFFQKKKTFHYLQLKIKSLKKKQNRIVESQKLKSNNSAFNESFRKSIAWNSTVHLSCLLEWDADHNIHAQIP